MPTATFRPPRSADGGLEPLLDALPEHLAEHLRDLDDFYSARAMERYQKRKGLSNDSDTTLSNRSIEAGKRLIEHVNGRYLGNLNLAAIVMDGVGVGGRTEYWAVGITMDGTKVPLGVVEAGKGESKKLVLELLHNLVRPGRELDVSDVLWVVDGGKGPIAAIKQFTNGKGAIQRCRVHKTRNVIRQNMTAKIRARIGGRTWKRLTRAWGERDPEKAADLLGQLASSLERQGQKEADPDVQKVYHRAAESVREGAEMTLTLKKLGKFGLDAGDGGGWRTIWDKLSSTNLIESVHSRLTRWTKTHVTRWQSDDHRMRFFLSAVACAEQHWNAVAIGRAVFEPMQLAMLRARNPDVDMELANAPERLTLSRFRVAAEMQRRAYPAMTDLLRWADRNGKVVELAPDALEIGDGAHRLRRALREHGFVANVEEGAEPGSLIRVPRERVIRPLFRGSGRRGGSRAAGAPDGTVRTEPMSAAEPAFQDPLAQFQGAGFDELFFGLGELALKAGPAMVRLSDEQLAVEASRLDLARAGVASLELRVGEWWDKNHEGQRRDRGWADKPIFSDAAREIALERERVLRGERPEDHPLGEGRSQVLGSERAQQLMGDSAYLGAWIRGASARYLTTQEAAVHNAFDDLDALVKRIDQAARAVAAAREQARRELVGAAASRVRAAGASAGKSHPTERDPPEPPNPIEAHEHRLGRHADALRAYGDALAEEMRDLDVATLREIQTQIGAPWKGLEGADALQTGRLEQRSKEAVRERGEALRAKGELKMRELAHGATKDERDLGETCVHTAGQLWDELRSLGDELATHRAKPGSLDRFVAEPLRPALDAAISIELGRRRELARRTEVEHEHGMVHLTRAPDMTEPGLPERTVGGLEV